MSALVALMLTAAPPVDLVALWNQVNPNLKVDPQTLDGGGTDCDKSTHLDVDTVNLFASMDLTVGPDCSGKQHTELTVFTRPGGAPPWVLSGFHGEYGSVMGAWELKDGKPVELPNGLDNLKPTLLLPKDLQREGDQLTYEKQYMGASITLPRKGTTLDIVLELGSMQRLCNKLDPKPAVCAPDALRKATKVKAKWNGKAGRFDVL